MYKGSFDGQLNASTGAWRPIAIASIAVHSANPHASHEFPNLATSREFSDRLFGCRTGWFTAIPMRLWYPRNHQDAIRAFPLAFPSSLLLALVRLLRCSPELCTSFRLLLHVRRICFASFRPLHLSPPPWIRRHVILPFVGGVGKMAAPPTVERTIQRRPNDGRPRTQRNWCKCSAARGAQARKQGEA